MRRTLAAALTAAALAATPATAGPSGSCLDPLFAPSAPRVVYYNPETGFYHVDVDAAESFARRAVAVVTCLA